MFREELVPLLDLKLGLENRDAALGSEHVRASALSKREISELIEAIDAFARPVEVAMKTRLMSPGPGDGMVLDVAINGQAEAPVTSNRKHFAQAGKRFGIPVLSPAELLEKMRKGNQDGDRGAQDGDPEVSAAVDAVGGANRIRIFTAGGCLFEPIHQCCRGRKAGPCGRRRMGTKPQTAEQGTCGQGIEAAR